MRNASWCGLNRCLGSRELWIRELPIPQELSKKVLRRIQNIFCCPESTKIAFALSNK